MTRHVTPAVRSKIEQWEGLRLESYQDGAGVWTIGFGHTGNVKPGQVCKAEQASKWLRADLLEAEMTVDRFVKVELSDNQFGALVAFVFNVGVAAFASSTLLRKLNAGDSASVPGELAKWNKITVSGKKVPSKGLSNRRAAEIGLWASGEHVASSAEPVSSAAPKPLMASKTVQGATVTGVGATGATLLDTANQVQVAADYSDTLRIVFVVLMLAGVGLTLYGRVSLRNREGV